MRLLLHSFRQFSPASYLLDIGGGVASMSVPTHKKKWVKVELHLSDSSQCHLIFFSS
jgi:hypothetical protein